MLSNCGFLSPGADRNLSSSDASFFTTVSEKDFICLVVYRLRIAKFFADSDEVPSCVVPDFTVSSKF